MTSAERYSRISLRMNWTSFSVGFGCSLREQLLSVVPANTYRRRSVPRATLTTLVPPSVHQNEERTCKGLGLPRQEEDDSSVFRIRIEQSHVARAALHAHTGVWVTKLIDLNHIVWKNYKSHVRVRPRRARGTIKQYKAHVCANAASE